MSIRSNWSDVDKKTREYVTKRDKRCIICNRDRQLTMAHIFISRAKGGKGCKENIVALCPQCHYYLLDNPIGKENIKKSQEMLEYCKKYLIEKEHIEYNNEFIESLKYNKSREIRLITLENIKPKTKNNICKNCEYLEKTKAQNSSISTYYCKKTHKIVSKSLEACKEYKNYLDY